jgi:DNA primase
MIKHESINELLSVIRIEDVIGQFVKLKKNGSNYTGLCPFHEEKTPSFSVSPSKGIYKCFGCGAGGHAIRFLMDYERLSFPEAAEQLAARYNVILQRDRESQPDPEAGKKEKFQAINKAAALKYHRALMGDAYPGSLAAREYLMHQRMMSLDSIVQWQIGWAPDEWQFITSAIVEKGLLTDAIEAGLCATKSERNYDVFRRRVMFPIHDLFMNIIGFGGRDISSRQEQKEKGISKYLNSKESLLFSKSKTLYGLPFAAKAIRKEQCAILVEGYTDVISFHAAGAENTVATCGTALTEDHCRVLKRYTQRIIIIRDGDQAGEKAMMRDIDILLAHEIKPEVFILPHGEDPDLYALKFIKQEEAAV